MLQYVPCFYHVIQINNHLWPQILTERGHVGAKTKQIVNALVPHNLREVLVPEKEFWAASKTLNFLLEGPYFKRDGETNTHWPKALKDMMDEGTPLVTGRCAKN